MVNDEARRDGEQSNKRGGLGRFGLASVIAVIASGCGGEGGSSTSYPVDGKILLADGKPLTAGRIMLVSPEPGLTFGGPVSSDGTYTLKTGARDGVPAGDYLVRIEVEETSLPTKGGAGRKSVVFPFAHRYADEDTSRLTASVKPEGPNHFEFKLEK